MDTPEASITLAIDAMGSDHGPSEVLAGVSEALNLAPRNSKFLVFGQEDVLGEIFNQYPNLNEGQVAIKHAPEVVEMDEKPIAGIKGKKKSSMSLALDSLKSGESDALLSCGNTGCLMAGSAIKLRTLEGLRDLPCVQFGQVEKDILHYWTQVRILTPNPFTSYKVRFLAVIMHGLLLNSFVRRWVF